MPRFEVRLTLTKEVTLDRVYGRDEDEAADKAVAIVEAWGPDIVEVDVQDVEEVSER